MNQRQQQIVKFLSSSDEWYKADVLASIFLVSTRTIRSDIKKINEEHNQEIIKSNNSYGYRYVNIDDSEAESLALKDLPETPKDRCIFILINLIKNDRGIKFDELTNQLCISSYCLDRDLKQLKINLEKYKSINIIKCSNRVYIEGDEEDKRNLYGDLLNYETDGNFLNISELAKYFNDFDLLFCKRIIDDLLKKYRFTLREMVIPSLVLFVAITIDRIIDGYSISDFDAQVDHDSKEYLIAKDFFDVVSKEYNFKFKTLEIDNLAYFLMARKCNECADIDDDIIDDIVDLLKDKFKIDVSNDEDFKVSLKLHVKSLIERKNQKIELDNLYLNELKHKYPMIFEIAIHVGLLLEKTYHFSINESEIGFLAIHIGAAYERMYNCNKHRVVLVYPLEQALSNLYLNKLEKLFKERINIVGCFNLFSDKEIKQLNPDLIITTLPLDHSLDIETIQVSLFVNDEDERNLMIALKKLDKLQFDKTYKQQIINKFNKRYCFSNLTSNDSENVIKQICKVLIEDGVIDSKYQESILKRESISPTSFSYGFAIPHALVNNAKKSSISVAMLDRSIKWGNYNVKLVILVTINEDDTDVFNHFFEWLAQICQNQNKISKIINSKSYDEIIKNLM